jgi:hypothetical protein
LDRDLKVAKKPYSAPSFQVVDADAARRELEAIETPGDASVRQMMSVLDRSRDGKTSPTPSTPETSIP